jgi:hypothetical protein
MLSLILTVFFVHVAIYLVNTIGASTVDSLVCIYNCAQRSTLNRADTYISYGYFTFDCLHRPPEQPASSRS